MKQKKQKNEERNTSENLFSYLDSQSTNINVNMMKRRKKKWEEMARL